MQPRGADASFRDLARATGVGTPTLRHYFDDRDGVIAAVLESVAAEGARYLLMVSATPTAPLADSLGFLLTMVVRGLKSGLGEVHALGLTAGLAHASLGPKYLDHILEPTLQAFEAHLAHHAARGALRTDVDLRLAALQLVSPLLLGALHQLELGGTRCRPLDLDALVEPHLASWLRAWARSADPPPLLTRKAPARGEQRGTPGSSDADRDSRGRSR
jgi:AcrR family transcriptional regulator